MTFWGVEVKPDKPITVDCLLLGGKLILTQATLGNGSSPKKSILQCNVRNRSPVFLCTLLPEKSESCSLNLEFDEEGDVKFSVVGPTSIHLAGFIQKIPQDLDDKGNGYGAYGEDIAGTESEESDYNSEEFSDYDFIDDLNCQLPQEPLDLQKFANDVIKSSIVPLVDEVVYHTLMQIIISSKPRTVGQVMAVLGYQGECSSMSQKVSSEKDSFDPSPDQEELCALYNDFEGIRTRVAYGVTTSSRVLDGAILPCGVVKVKVDGALEKFAPLPCPVNDEITQVQHAVETYVAWPRYLCYTIGDFMGSICCKQSPHLTGFVQKVPQDLDDKGDWHDAYGEDIGGTESEESDYNSEESSDYDFIDDDDMTMYPLSPVSNSGVTIEERADDEKASGEIGTSNQSKKKKNQLADTKNDQKAVVVKENNGAFVLESEDEDSFSDSEKSEPNSENGDTKTEDGKHNKNKTKTDSKDDDEDDRSEIYAMDHSEEPTSDTLADKKMRKKEPKGKTDKTDDDTKKVVPEVRKTPTTDTEQSKAKQAKDDLMGQGVGIKECWQNSSKGHGPGSGVPQIDLQKIVNDAVEETKKLMLKDIIYLFPETVDEVLMILSCHAESSSMSEQVEGELCALNIDFEGSRALVAYGVITSSRVLDGAILPSGVVRVRVDKAIEDFAPLPCPVNDEIRLVRHALETYVAWPSNLCDPGYD